MTVSRSRTCAGLSGAFALALAFAPTLAWANEPAPPPATQEGKPIDLVICLDVSGSMNELLDSCRRKIWDLCTLLAQARPAPRLRVALLTFGGESDPQGDHVVLSRPLSRDLDTTYDELMKLDAGGSRELVGSVLARALEQLQWSEDPGALRIVVVAGNESADQDRERDFRAVCAQALQRSIRVNAVFCGVDGPQGDAATWREVAERGGGEYAAIDTGGTISIQTPYDAELTRLSAAVNATYLPFGARGGWYSESQRRQDASASSLGSSTAAARATTKGSAAYSNDHWDLVDASAQEGFDWDGLDPEHLPEHVRYLTPSALKEYVELERAKRARLQAEIQALAAKRQAFVDAALAEQQGDAARSLDVALGRAFRAQAEAVGFRFD